MPDLDPGIDAVQLARCLYIGNWESFWAIMSDYFPDLDQLEDDPIGTHPQATLVFHLALLIKYAVFSQDYDSADDYFDTNYQAASEDT
ncbi:MAG TPA: hypothetical protein DIW80_19445 [Gordonia polyisoprenivorans]|uniref:hypothetical protein n=1 Tax=uncultured Gordonia sp. TaxID=198437 RepID=UPI000EED2036|nr:hypothetical protein [uncultured Gordonia sp.]HCS59059.1 hypothetical protein [Gordonia polyisoprenivorans]